MLPKGFVPRTGRCKSYEDESGAYWEVEQDGRDTEELCAWWTFTKNGNPRGRTKHTEYLSVRQENTGEKADVIVLSLGQVYDLIDLLNKAVLGR